MLFLTTNFNQLSIFAISESNFINLLFIKITQKAKEEKSEKGRKDV